jgi:hypothetical protein
MPGKHRLPQRGQLLGGHRPPRRVAWDLNQAAAGAGQGGALRLAVQPAPPRRHVAVDRRLLPLIGALQPRLQARTPQPRGNPLLLRLGLLDRHPRHLDLRQQRIVSAPTTQVPLGQRTGRGHQLGPVGAWRPARPIRFQRQQPLVQRPQLLAHPPDLGAGEPGVDATQPLIQPRRLLVGDQKPRRPTHRQHAHQADQHPRQRQPPPHPTVCRLNGRAGQLLVPCQHRIPQRRHLVRQGLLVAHAILRKSVAPWSHTAPSHPPACHQAFPQQAVGLCQVAGFRVVAHAAGW